MSGFSTSDAKLIANIVAIRENNPHLGARLATDAIAQVQARNPELTAELQLQLGTCLLHVDRYSDALEAFGEARLGFEAVGQAMGMGRAWGSIGGTYRALSLYNAAKLALGEAFRVFATLDAHYEKGKVLQNLAVVSTEMGQLNDAIRLTEDAIGCYDSAGAIALDASLFSMNDLVIIRVRRAQDAAYWDEHDPDDELERALATALKAKSLAGEVRSLRLWGSLNASHGEVLIELSRLPAAEEVLGRAQKIADRLNYPYMRARVLRLKGLAALKAGDEERALARLGAAEAIAAELQRKLELAQTLLALADVHWAANRIDRAFDCLKRHAFASDALHPRVASDEPPRTCF